MNDRELKRVKIMSNERGGRGGRRYVHNRLYEQLRTEKIEKLIYMHLPV
jgi:hypothetical protein